MRVWIDGRWYDSLNTPIVLSLSMRDKKTIDNMSVDECLIGSHPNHDFSEFDETSDFRNRIPGENSFLTCMCNMFRIIGDDKKALRNGLEDAEDLLEFLEVWAKQNGMVVLHSTEGPPADSKSIACGLGMQGYVRSVLWDDGKVLHDPDPDRELPQLRTWYWFEKETR